jgi:hypothetical protein
LYATIRGVETIRSGRRDRCDHMVVIIPARVVSAAVDQTGANMIVSVLLGVAWLLLHKASFMKGISTEGENQYLL